MLTFFRRIRKGLLGDGATSKYLLYAIGEIALVVIGILIALQINNWNEWRKDRIKENKSLIEISKNLESNVNLLTSISSNLTRYNLSSEIIFSVIENKLPYTDSLPEHFYLTNQQGGGRVFGLEKTGFDELKNLGFGILRTDSLKNSIISYFETVLPGIETRVSRFHSYYSDYNSYMIKLFVPDKVSMALYPVEYEDLTSDMYYYSMIRTIWTERQGIKYFIGQCLIETQRVLNLIKQELGEG